jgi:hypothetical protein
LASPARGVLALGLAAISDDGRPARPLPVFAPFSSGRDGLPS